MSETAEVIALDESRGAQKKDLYDVGEIPPLGHVPKQMYAWAVRRARHGDPTQAFQADVVDTPAIADDAVLISVLAACVTYNGVRLCPGLPVPGCAATGSR